MAGRSLRCPWRWGDATEPANLRRWTASALGARCRSPRSRLARSMGQRLSDAEHPRYLPDSMDAWGPPRSKLLAHCDFVDARASKLRKSTVQGLGEPHGDDGPQRQSASPHRQAEAAAPDPFWHRRPASVPWRTRHGPAGGSAAAPAHPRRLRSGRIATRGSFLTWRIIGYRLRSFHFPIAMSEEH